MPLGGKVSGLAVAAGIGGGIILLSAYKNATILDTLRAVLRNDKIVSRGPGLSGITTSGITGSGQAGPGSSTGAAVAATAASWVGKVPYRWGGEDPSGWDCSGFVTYVLHTQNGIDLPSNVHTTAAGFLIWGGATTVPRSECSPGDLVCWASHIGIAVSSSEMINAPTFGHMTERARIWSVPVPTIRRPKAYAAKVNVEAFQ